MNKSIDACSQNTESDEKETISLPKNNSRKVIHINMGGLNFKKDCRVPNNLVKRQYRRGFDNFL